MELNFTLFGVGHCQIDCITLYNIVEGFQFNFFSFSYFLNICLYESYLCESSVILLVKHDSIHQKWSEIGHFNPILNKVKFGQAVTHEDGKGPFFFFVWN